MIDFHTATGQVFSFGYNSNGQLGDGTTTQRNIPVAVSTSGVLNGLNITAIAGGYYHSLVLSCMCFNEIVLLTNLNIDIPMLISWNGW